MESCGKIGAVGVPGQDVEGGRFLAHQVVVDPVVEDQVVRSHPREHAAHRSGVDYALAPGTATGEVEHGA